MIKTTESCTLITTTRFTYKIFKFRDFFFQEIRTNFIVLYHTGNLKFLHTVCHRNELAYQQNEMLTLIPSYPLFFGYIFEELRDLRDQSLCHDICYIKYNHVDLQKLLANSAVNI